MKNIGDTDQNTGAPYGILEPPIYYPYGVAVDSSGNLYITGGARGLVAELNQNGTLIKFIGGYSMNAVDTGSPFGIARDSSGNIYVADNFNGIVVEFDSGGGFVKNIGSGKGSGDGQMSNPTGVAVDSRGNVYAADNDNNRVEEFDSSGAFVRSLGVSGSGQLIYPNGIAIDSSDNVFVTSGVDSVIVEFNSRGGFVQNIGADYAGFVSPAGLALDKSDNLYVLDSIKGAIVVFRKSVAAPAPGSVSGVLTFAGVASFAPAQDVTFTFRPDDGSAEIVQSQAVPSTGEFTLPNLPLKAGVLHTKPNKYLAVNAAIDLSGGSLSGLALTAQPGDANNDNSCDSTDFSILISAYNTLEYNPNSGYDYSADFNSDGAVDAMDFSLLVGNFNQQGDL